MFALGNCIGYLDQLGFQKEAWGLCPKAASGLEQISPLRKETLAVWVRHVGQVWRLAIRHADKEMEDSVASSIREQTEKSSNPEVLAELLLWEPHNDFPNREEIILRTLKITDPASTKSTELTRHLLTLQRHRQTRISENARHKEPAVAEEIQ